MTLLQKMAKSLLLLCLLFILWWTTPSQAIANAAPVPKLENPQELETFFDGIFSAYLEDRQIVGASVSVVKDGELFLAKGYGNANLEKNIPVESDRTLFRIGSVSKLFTWTAVMQLVEQGKLDLNADVNIYLKNFQIPATYSQPITLSNLLTHTPGFEEWGLGAWAKTANGIVPLRQWLALRMPRRVYPPGELTAYSNYGAALAGYIVEVVSGIPFEQYVAENIFKPLEMNHSSFGQPLPENLAANLAVGYTNTEKIPIAKPFEYSIPFPAGAMSSTATDMAKFAIAHLQNGSYKDKRILETKTAQMMHQQQFTNHPRVNGMTYGFIEGDRNRVRIIGHWGDTLLFHSRLALLPEQNVGLFVVCNSAAAHELPHQVLQAFLDRYYPIAPASTPPLAEGFRSRVRRLTGNYLISRTNYSKLEKIGQLFEQQIQVRATRDRLLAFNRQWIEIEPWVFREVDGEEILAFAPNRGDRLTRLYRGERPPAAFLKLPWYRTSLYHFVLLGICIILFLSAIGVWLSSFFVDKKYRPQLSRLIGVPVVIGSAGNLVFLVMFVISFSDIFAIVTGIPTTLKIALIIPLLTTAMAIASVFFTFRLWQRNHGLIQERVHYTLVTLALLAFTWFCSYWNLLGFQF